MPASAPASLPADLLRPEPLHAERRNGPIDQVVSWIASWLWPESASRRTSQETTTSTASSNQTSTPKARGDHHNQSLAQHPKPSACGVDAEASQLARTADVLVLGSGLPQSDLVLAANTTQQWLTAIKTQLGLTGLAGLSGTDAVTVCLSITNDGQLAMGSFQGLRLKPLSVVTATGVSQANWQAALAHELVKVVQAVLLQDRTNRHPLPRWFEEGMASYLSQGTRLASVTEESSWTTQYNSSGQCGPLDIVTMRDLQRCGVTQEATAYRPAYTTLFHLLFDSTADGGAGQSLGTLTGVLTNMAYGSTFSDAFSTLLGATATVAWHGHPLAPAY